MKRAVTMLALAAVTVFAAAASAQQPPATAPQHPVADAAPPTPNDYSDQKTWLCRPGRKGDACDVDETATVVSADGTLTRETFTASSSAPIDCFYVYPTVSTQPTPNANMNVDPAELNVVRQQFARFASKCRPYAPMYRQVTTNGLLPAIRARDGALLAHDVQYADVKDAWTYYLQHDNGGRGVVLIGHSQGSFILNRLIREEIEGKPVESRLVSAILLGTVVVVPKGKDAGGTFDHLPLCRTASQAGCVITYASFRSTLPPPSNTLFGFVRDPETMVAACTNPAALAGGSGELHAYFDTKGGSISAAQGQSPAWVASGGPIETPFVTLPGLLTAKCASNEFATYLEITVNGNPADPRIDDIPGDLRFGANVAPVWGLHLVDMNLAIGNLVDIVGQQTKTYLAKQ